MEPERENMVHAKELPEAMGRAVHEDMLLKLLHEMQE